MSVVPFRRTLYVTPEGLARMRQAMDEHNDTRPVPDPDGAAHAALRAVGVSEREIEAAYGRGFKVKMAGTGQPSSNLSQGSNPSGRTAPPVVAKK